MANHYRVAWRQGMFLRPQHFQAQDRYFEYALRARADSLQPWPWGLTVLEIDQDLAALGKFSIVRASGVFEDGTNFTIDANSLPPPPPIEVPAEARDLLVSLTLSAAQPGSVEFAEPSEQAMDVRFLVEEADVADSFSNDRETEPLELARPNLRIALTNDQREGKLSIGLARVREVRNNRLNFDDRYIPPALDIDVSAKLSGAVSDILARCIARRDELANRVVTSAEAGAEEIANFVLLQALNRAEQVLKHLGAMPTIHPERLYETLVGFAAEVATSVQDDHKLPAVPPYRHDDLQESFERLVDVLRRMLAVERPDRIERLDLEEVRAGQYLHRITNNALFETGDFYLAVKASQPQEELLRLFAKDAKLGPAHLMKRINLEAVEGIGLRHVHTVPPQLRVQRGYVYFELDRGQKEWSEFYKATGLGIIVSNIWSDLKLDLWCVKVRK